MIVAFSVTPLGGTGDSVSAAVAAAVRVVRDSGLRHETNAMFTNVEGDYDAVMDVVKRAVLAAKAGAPRVSVTLKMDIRDGVTDGLTEKVAAVERRLG